MLLVAIDPSLTNTAILCIEVDEPGPSVAAPPKFDVRQRVTLTTGPKDGTDCERFVRLHDRLKGLLQNWGPDQVAIEGYSFDSPNNATRAGGLGFALRWACHQVAHGWPVEISPNSAKKFATGKGNARKDEMMLAVYKRWGFDPASEHEADAYAVGRVAVARAWRLAFPDAGGNPWTTLEYEREALAGLFGVRPKRKKLRAA